MARSPYTSSKPNKRMKRSINPQINKYPPKSIEEEKGKNIMGTYFEYFKVPIIKNLAMKYVASKKRRRRLILNDSSQSIEPVENPSKDEDNQKSYRTNFHTGIYMRKPHTRPTNKLRLNSKIMSNPMIKYLTINMDETPISKEKKNAKQKGKTQKAQTKQGGDH